MPYRISRLGHVEIQSVDLDRDVDYYLNVLGLQQTGREGQTVYLKGWDERHAYSFDWRPLADTRPIRWTRTPSPSRGRQTR
jgi:catechol 2,3-dioxygenase-like lactoylglutathione lyase family enzyme